MQADVLVYELDSRHYVANFGEGGWVKWPAEENGWARRVTCGDPGNDAYELPPKNAALALLLSGVEDL